MTIQVNNISYASIEISYMLLAIIELFTYLVTRDTDDKPCQISREYMY